MTLHQSMSFMLASAFCLLHSGSAMAAGGAPQHPPVTFDGPLARKVFESLPLTAVQVGGVWLKQDGGLSCKAVSEQEAQAWSCTLRDGIYSTETAPYLYAAFPVDPIEKDGGWVKSWNRIECSKGTVFTGGTGYLCRLL